MRRLALLTICRAVPALAAQGAPVHGVESQSRPTNPVTVNGMSGVLYDGECAGAGETFSKRMMLMRVPEGPAVIEDSSVNVLKACP